MDPILQNMADERQPSHDYLDPREQPVMDALAREFRDIVKKGGEIRLVCSQPEPLPPVDVPKARAAQQRDRLMAARAMAPQTAKELHRQKLHDSASAVFIGNAILASEADERLQPPQSFTDLTPAARQDLTHDAVVSLRMRRPAWRAVSRLKAQQAIADGLKEHASHLLNEQERIAITAFLTGPVWTAAVETLSGRIEITAVEFAQAILQCGDR